MSNKLKKNRWHCCCISSQVLIFCFQQKSSFQQTLDFRQEPLAVRLFEHFGLAARQIFEPSHPEFWMIMSPPRIHAPKSLFLKEIRVSMTAATRGRVGFEF